MRSLAATITVVAFLANVSHVHAADGVTTPVAGWCSATPEVALFELTDLVSDAKCASDASVRVDPHLVAMVSERLVYEAQCGKDSTERAFQAARLPRASRASSMRYRRNTARSTFERWTGALTIRGER